MSWAIFFFVMENLYLMHFGIKGQKWGVRRYQNADGSLTAKGKTRLQNYAKKYSEESTNSKSIKKAGIQISKDGTDVIKKGSLISRQANTGETLDTEPKYVSITDNDRRTYFDLANQGKLRLDPTKKASTYIYEADKDLKVANFDNVEKYVNNQIKGEMGNKKVSELYKDRSDSDFMKAYTNQYISKYGDRSVKDFMDTYSLVNKAKYTTTYGNTNNTTSDFVKRTKDIASMVQGDYFEKNLNKISSKYKKDGYDAISDMMDYGLAEYPVIMLNPKNSMRLKYEI